MTKESAPVTKEITKEIQGIPTISFGNKNVRSSLDWDETTISVSDTTANGALDVFKQVIKELEEKK